MKGSVLRGLRAAGEIVLPRICLVCGQRLLLNERHLCLNCLADLPLTFYWSMSHNPMADKFNEMIQKEGPPAHERYAFAASLIFYHSEAEYRLIPYQIKYHGNTDAGRFFGRMLGSRLAASEQFADVDMVVPVPLHWTRRLKRGYDQAEVIASGVAESMGIPLRNDLLKRRRRTRTQTKMEVEEKVGNVTGAFMASPGSSPSSDIRHILIVDDVFTTGSTLYACFSALRSIFPPSVRISVATLAFVGRA
jgi:ComF family protein